VLLIQFVFLQICDLLTTLAFLRLGVSEANPLVRLALGVARTNPAAVLLSVKGVGILCGWYAWHSGRRRLLVRTNWLFAACVVWNVLAIAVGSA
jgi:Domain of unknown function (DUF5658)